MDHLFCCSECNICWIKENLLESESIKRAEDECILTRKVAMIMVLFVGRRIKIWKNLKRTFDSLSRQICTISSLFCTNSICQKTECNQSILWNRNRSHFSMWHSQLSHVHIYECKSKLEFFFSIVHTIISIRKKQTRASLLMFIYLHNKNNIWNEYELGGVNIDIFPVIFGHSKT